MPLYTCKIGSSDGRILTKELDSVSEALLRQSLEEQGYAVFEVRKKPFQFLLESGIGRKKIGNKELLLFNQELLVLLKAGLPIIQALDTILESGTGKLNEILNAVREDIKGGLALSAALEKYPRVFPQLYIASIRAGERTGDLPQTIRRYIAFLKRTEGFRGKIIGAMFYPAILVSVAFVAITVLLIYVVPTFSTIYADSGNALPVPTQMLINFTVFLRHYLLVFVALIFGAVTIFKRWKESESGRYTVDGMKIKTPLVGTVVVRYALAGFTRTLATVLGSGIPIVEAMRMSVGTLNNKVLERGLLMAVHRVEEGSKLSTALENMKLLPPLALRMLSVGETTGALEEMLGDISDYFEDEIERSLQVLTTAIEPAIMIVMGVVIGTIIITMYLPIFKIASTVT
ncbi:type II secretion system F family protein [Geomonas sp. Red69]|uniref:Type II secretion system F family protein n=1 Tax=Geomonas diazotrophica TaxID=2843197 RepID=A0ABX8JGE2_9BACT|nr:MULTISPECIES: type II secretion system F family protein [Geomonas]MBU5637742.1 type II secretion system F family protein [Geomonas diazotrophica]QWV96277.1 type II secretion system F family protein [Geomonas nitrogeniifigens]QXE85344.1 type II secretion system F family protein [Geomonas nitrogeniifigens]